MRSEKVLLSNQEKDLAYFMTLPYSILLTPDEAGGWYASIPLLDGCMSDGDSEAEALKMLEDARRLWLEWALEKGIAIPEPERIGFP